jgi:hypothetical protein
MYICVLGGKGEGVAQTSIKCMCAGICGKLDCLALEAG